MLRLAFDFIITWRETRTRPNAYGTSHRNHRKTKEFIFLIINYLHISYILHFSLFCPFPIIQYAFSTL